MVITIIMIMVVMLSGIPPGVDAKAYCPAVATSLLQMLSSSIPVQGLTLNPISQTVN